MTDKKEETIHDNEVETCFCKPPGLNIARILVFADNRFNTYLVLIFSDLNIAQIYKLPYRDNSHHEIEFLVSFNQLNLLKPNDEKVLSEILDKKHIYGCEKIVNFETNVKIKIILQNFQRY